MGRPDDVRVFFWVDGPGMVSLQPASMCWLINCPDTCREHIGLWLKAVTENHKEPETPPDACLPSDYNKSHLYINRHSAEHAGLTSPVLELLAMAVLAD